MTTNIKILENRFKDDEIINEILISSNVRENYYKDTYNNNLKFSCLDNNCDDKKVIYVNSHYKYLLIFVIIHPIRIFLFINLVLKIIVKIKLYGYYH